MLPIFLALIATAPPTDDPSADRIVAFASSRLGERVGDGQCSGLVAEALEAAGARRGFGDSWGEPLDPAADLRAGDVLVFRDAVYVRKWTLPNRAVRTATITMRRHVAIVEEFRRGPGSTRITILHQNAGPTDLEPARRQVVQRWEIDPKGLRSGEMSAYRPVPDSRPEPAGDPDGGPGDGTP